MFGFVGGSASGRGPVPASVGRFCAQAQDHGLDKSLDVTTLLDVCKLVITESACERVAGSFG